jgi:alkylated DNA repair dioxygenase AlkB
MSAQPGLFPPPTPEGFAYTPNLITRAEEAALAVGLAELPFEPFDFHGHIAHREVAGFGQRYDYASGQVRAAAPIPAFLIPLRATVAACAGLPPEAFEQLLINRYRAGAGIGWHRDKPHFDVVAGVSLLSPCAMRFRRKRDATWDRLTALLEPRSAYLLTGPARHAWEHSIAAHPQPRYSITFRTLANK